MCSLLKNIIPLLLIILKLCTSISGNFTLKDLGFVCGVLNCTRVPSPPKQCTAMSAWSNDAEQLSAVNKTKGNLPLMIREVIDFNNIGNVSKDAVEALYKDLDGIDFDYMLFDNTYYALDIRGSEEVQDFTQTLITILNVTRAVYAKVMYGLVLGYDINDVQNYVDLMVLDVHFDFFLLDSVIYRQCSYNYHQKDMNVLATKDDILGSIDVLKHIGIPLNKIIYSIDLTIRSRMEYSFEDMNYSYLCSNKLSRKRKYCFNTIENIFEKARLRLTENLVGIYTDGIDFDDVDGTCGCKTPSDKDPAYRGIKTIAGASQEDKNDCVFYDCVEGAYPIIKA